MKNKKNDFQKVAMHSFLFRLYLLKNLPMAFLAGLRVMELTPQKSVVSVPFKYLTKNPFKSIYFACLSMAAELSTGVLSMLSIQGERPGISMLIVDLKAEFIKKASGKILFTCNDGPKAMDAVESCRRSGEGVLVTLESIGSDEAGDVVAKFYFTWSFKQKHN